MNEDLNFKNQRDMIAWLAEGGTICMIGNRHHMRSMSECGRVIRSESSEDVSLSGLNTFNNYTKIIKKPMVKVYRPKWFVDDEGLYYEGEMLPWGRDKERYFTDVIYYLNNYTNEWEEKEVPAEVFE